MRLNWFTLTIMADVAASLCTINKQTRGINSINITFVLLGGGLLTIIFSNDHWRWTWSLITKG